MTCLQSSGSFVFCEEIRKAVRKRSFNGRTIIAIASTETTKMETSFSAVMVLKLGHFTAVNEQKIWSKNIQFWFAANVVVFSETMSEQV